jgi:hypothetical protein
MFSEQEKNNIRSIKELAAQAVAKRLNDFPGVLEDFLKQNAILSGGAIPSFLNGESPNDYDLYLSDENHIMFFKQYVLVMDHNLIKDVDEKYLDAVISGKLVTANATTFKNGIQVITMHTADARTTFDFVHCMPWYKISQNLLHISKRQYDAIKSKTLIKNEHPNAFHLSQKRVDKYTDRGWKFK